VAEDLTRSVPAASEPLVEGAQSRAPLVQGRHQAVAYRARFALAYLALAAVAGAALGATIVLVDRPDRDAAPWSQWEPAGPEGRYATEIARYVAPRYRDPQDNRLVSVFAGPSEIGGERVLGAVVTADTGDPADATPHEFGKSLFFQFCAGSEACAFPDGNLDEERLRVLRRQSLELALYSFKYVDDLETVTTLLPPDPDETTPAQGDARTLALFFERGDLGEQLERPLSQTLGEGTVVRVGAMSPRESRIVDTLTVRRTFGYSFTRVQSGSWVMVLNPLDQALGR
jgi:hypothetical protein